MIKLLRILARKGRAPRHTPKNHHTRKLGHQPRNNKINLTSGRVPNQIAEEHNCSKSANEITSDEVWETDSTRGTRESRQ